jgi:hypothetical protein
MGLFDALAALKAPSSPNVDVLAPSSWDQAAADALLADVEAHRRQLFGPTRWPEDPEACCRLAEQADVIDAAWLARDMTGVRKATTEYLVLLSQLSPRPPAL